MVGERSGSWPREVWRGGGGGGLVSDGWGSRPAAASVKGGPGRAACGRECRQARDRGDEGEAKRWARCI
jgi:hypothetical protein